MTDQPHAALHTDADIARVKRLTKMQRMAEAGFTITQTAQALETSRASVLRFAKRNGVVFHQRTSKPGAEDELPSIVTDSEIRVRDVDDYREAVQDMKPLVAVDYLLGLLDGLTHQLPEMNLSPLPGLSLSRLEARLLHHLDRRRNQPVTEEALMFALYQLRPDKDWPGTKIIAVRVCNIRRKLRLAKISNVQIDSCRGVGFCLRVSSGVRLDWYSKPDAGTRP